MPEGHTPNNKKRQHTGLPYPDTPELMDLAGQRMKKSILNIILKKKGEDFGKMKREIRNHKEPTTDPDMKNVPLQVTYCYLFLLQHDVFEINHVDTWGSSSFISNVV